MAFRVTFKEQSIDLADGESILDGLARQNITIPSSCRSGACQSCLMRATDGSAPPASQTALKPTQRERGFFLACQCIPQSNLTVTLPDEQDQMRYDARIIELKKIASRLLRIRLAIPTGYTFKAGQYLRVHRDGKTRCYSIASLPREGFLELHVRHYPGGLFSTWLYQNAREGDSLSVSEACGASFYVSEKSEQPILMVATGSGLAPLWGIMRDALEQGHTGEVRVFHGSHDRSGLYYRDELADLAARYPSLSYYPCVSGELTDETLFQGRADDLALERFPKLNEWRLFLCGNPNMVNSLKRKAFLAGASLQDILTDPFIDSSKA